MGIDPQVVVKTLVEEGFREVHMTQKMLLLHAPRNADPVYVNMEVGDGTSVLRIHPKHRTSVEATHFDGVTFEGERFHSNMREFPKKMNEGLHENHYGLAFTFDSFNALRRFVDLLK